jgi:hypothetical protein
MITVIQIVYCRLAERRIETFHSYIFFIEDPEILAWAVRWFHQVFIGFAWISFHWNFADRILGSKAGTSQSL